MPSEAVGTFGLKLRPAKQILFATQAYTFTDCHHKVINALLYNLSLNFPAAEEGSEDGLQKCCECGPPEAYTETTVRSASYARVRKIKLFRGNGKKLSNSQAQPRTLLLNSLHFHC